MRHVKKVNKAKPLLERKCDTMGTKHLMQLFANDQQCEPGLDKRQNAILMLTLQPTTLAPTTILVEADNPMLQRKIVLPQGPLSTSMIVGEKVSRKLM